MSRDSDPTRAKNATEAASAGVDKTSLEALRGILLHDYRQRVAELEAELSDVEQRINDKEALISTITPVLGDAIRRKIRDARKEMIEALYPIIGQLVMRAVSEAIRDLARKVDAQVRTSFNLQVMWWRLRARIGGASSTELSLRQALPFGIAEIFLIHRETGLLLRRVSSPVKESPDSDLVSSMLTAIRQFAEDAFGRGDEAELDVIEYGDRRIVIEAGQHAYVAAVVDGTEPPGFRAAMRERVIEVEHTYGKALDKYGGDASQLAAADDLLRSLMVVQAPSKLSGAQQRLLMAALGLMFVCVTVSCLAGRWALQTLRMALAPTPMPTAVQVTPTFTLTPMPTLTSTSTQTPTATWTPTPSPVLGVMTGHVWMRQQPARDAPLLGVIIERGERVMIRAVYGEWCQIVWTPEPHSEVIGWVPLQWVGAIDGIPERVTTPTGTR